MSVRDPGDDDINRRFEQLVAGWQQDAEPRGSSRPGDDPASAATGAGTTPGGADPADGLGGTEPSASQRPATDRTPPRRLPPAPVEPAARERHSGGRPASARDSVASRWAARPMGGSQPRSAADIGDDPDDEPFEPPAVPPITVRPGVAIGFALLAAAFLLAFLMMMGVDIGRTLGALAGGLGVVGLVLLLLNVRRGPRDDSLDYDPRDGSRL